MGNFKIHKVPDEIDELVGLNTLPETFIENLLPPRDKQHENSDEKTSLPEERIIKATILVPKTKKEH